MKKLEAILRGCSFIDKLFSLREKEIRRKLEAAKAECKEAEINWQISYEEAMQKLGIFFPALADDMQQSAEDMMAGLHELYPKLFDIDIDTFNSSKRTRDVAQARQVAMYLAKQHTKSPLTVIGSSIGGRNHATVLHSCKAVADMIDTDKQFKAQMEEIEKLVLSK